LMIQLEQDGFVLLCEEETGSKGLIIKGYEGGSPTLDLSGLEIAEIDRKAFLSCKILRKIILPGSVTGIGDWAFSKCQNLSELIVNGDFTGGIFDRGVFDNCGSLRKIAFSNLCEDATILLAFAVNRMSNDHLIRGNDLGEKSWFEKWDLSLSALLNTDDTDGSNKTALCGEEDIFYAGVGMIDGEMPGETEEYIRTVAKNKCILVFSRLKHDTDLDPEMRCRFEAYIRDRGFGTGHDFAWRTLKEECANDMELWQMYLDIVKPQKDIVNRMIEDLNRMQVQAKAFLINTIQSEDDGLGDLLF